MIFCKTGGKAFAPFAVHNPSRNMREARRVCEEGGILWQNRVVCPSTKLHACPTMAVSRSIGDIAFKHPSFTLGSPSGVSAEPDIFETVLSEDLAFVVLACDGLWDVMKHQEVSDFVLLNLCQCDDPQKVSEQLVQKALQRGSGDNVTVVVVAFRHFSPEDNPYSGFVGHLVHETRKKFCRMISF